jgi:type IV pilus assembly protein PilB
MVDLRTIEIPTEILNLIPKQTAVDLSVLPLRMETDGVVIAMRKEADSSLLSDLMFLLGKRVKAEIVPDAELTDAIRRLYGVSELEMSRSSASDSHVVSVHDEERREELSSDGSVVDLANRIISDAVRMGASDIHVESYERKFRVRYRIDGILHEILHPSMEKSKPLVSRLKIMADLDIAEKRRPQDGRIRVKEGDRVIDIRVSTLPTDFGEKVVLRILDKSQLQLDLEKLGFEQRDLDVFKKIVHLPFGMVLVTGPTGSGKTTTLYAALNHINRPEINITTIEDPIEYNLPGINQTHVRADIGLTFAAALRSILRQDPNVIMVGEIRDGDTAEIAIRAALTGHLVFSTLHTNDAPSAITRLIDMGVEPFLVASSVKMILAQRLLRKLCPKCRELTKPTAEQLSELGLEKKAKHDFYTPKGCSSCNRFGYKGRTAVYEVLPINNGLSEMIARGVTANELRQQGQTEGFLSLRQAAVEKAERGETSLEEVIRETAG